MTSQRFTWLPQTVASMDSVATDVQRMASSSSHVMPDVQARVHHLPHTNPEDACRRALRALRSLSEARSRERGDLWRQASILQDALRTTPLGQGVEAGVLAKLVLGAEYATMPAKCHVELAGVTDALYVVLGGLAEIVRRPSHVVRTFTLTVEGATGLTSFSSDGDVLDPYVLVRIGSQEARSQVHMDAGSNPTWNWSANFLYIGEPEIEFHVMEYDQFSKHDCLGVANLSQIDFISAAGFQGSLPLSPPSDTLDEGGANLGSNARLNLTTKAAGTADMGKIDIKITWVSEVQVGKAAKADQGEVNLAKTDPGLASSLAAATEDTLANTVNISSVMNHSRSKPRLKEANPRASRDEDILNPGQYFGIEDGGGAWRTLEPCQMMIIPRAHVSEAFRSYREQVRNERTDFLCKHLPGMQGVDAKARNSLASAFQEMPLPKGHILCRGGALDRVDKSEGKRIYLIKQGTCSMQAVPSPSVEASSPPQKKQEGLRSSSKPASVGLLGPGALVGYASALFGVPEPFTAVAEEPLIVLWIGLDQRPFSAWPKDVVNRLREALTIRTDWHSHRSKALQVSIATSNALKAEAGDRMPNEWKASESPKLRHKQLTLWRAETLRDRFDAEGWAGGPPGAALPTSPIPRAASAGVLCSAASARGGGSLLGSTRTSVAPTPIGTCTPGDLSTRTRATTSSMRLASISSALSQADTDDDDAHKEPQGPGSGHRGKPAPRGSYAVNTGLGRCPTPWGTWSPSGMLPPPSPSLVGSSAGSPPRRTRRKLVVSTNARELATSPRKSSEDQEHRERSALHRQINLKCPSDWQCISSVASTASLGKMYRQQMRGSVVRESFASRPRSSAGLGLSQSLSEGALFHDHA